MDKFTIVSQNVLAWIPARRYELGNYYRTQDPDVILLNSTGLKHQDNIKIWGYNTYHCNKSNENSSGIAIAVRKGIEHRLDDEYQDNVLSVKLNTSKGPVELLTTYSPPRRPNIPVEDILKSARKPHPVYILADLNAAHQSLGHNYNNHKGTRIATLIDRGLLSHLGPNFPTWFSRELTSAPDITTTTSIWNKGN